ncbi:lipid-A-disaccharide synthase N-terminal domain-containing protein [Algoriphagus zhangzhouensis]|uniref:4-amino-4-deoxy-L-arabinose transferase n=1 Tax=Algoriphagus zhangzhouensis TaxID=1073327 RepID=A0A1M7Z5R6_9BACT|nr:lipid-A-disaccharide synthase N-terminal domain-containing protein [Algoriphagus zhangzhouensis]TDY48969.1 4-amino-4-deoxy-L-arabinose transferase-like glycosyltransferase [Algoriphagus zhangzhouensis]SHO60231.1 4-amino-4-deoxy-L-arabinose transferase [Algoriphagus zhangzhouensis]
MNPMLLLGLGFLAQGMFSARFLIQLVKTEKSGKVANPLIFWQLSLFASLLLMVYGTFRHDVIIVVGQLIGYYIYIRNLQLKNSWELFPKAVRRIFLIIPIFFFAYIFGFREKDFFQLINNPELDAVLLTWGSIGQVIFTGRFLIQWYVSEKQKKSVFPNTFWIVSILGAMIIAIYAIIRKDAVLFIGQSFGLVVYFRNLWVSYWPDKKKKGDLILKLKDSGIYILLVLMVLVLFFNLGGWSVTESSEARYAQIGKEMFESGDWIHPKLMEIHHYHKPPFTYWVTAISYKIFGISPFSARFFLQISALIQIVLAYLLAKVAFKDQRKALLSAILYAACPLLIIGVRGLTTDMFLTTWVLAGIYFNWKYRDEKKPLFAVLSFLCYGFGFLTKGPVVWIVPFTLELAWWIRGKKKPQFKWPQIVGWFLMLGIGFSWFIYLYIEDSRFLDYFLFKHTVQRFASDTFKRGQPFYFYWVILLVLSFPWFLLILTRLKKLWKSNTETAVLMFGFLVSLVFFSISQSKLILYILPLMAGMILVAVVAWEDLSISQKKKWEKGQLILHLLIWGGFCLLPWIEPRAILSMKFWLIWFLTISFLLALWKTGIHVKNRAIFSSLVFTVGLTLIASYFFSANLGLVNDTKRVVELIDEVSSPDERIVIFDKRLPSILFNSDRDVLSIYDGDDGLNREVQFEEDDRWKEYLINLKEDPNWIQVPNHQSGIWLAKERREMPALENGKVWKELGRIDGYKLLRIK